MPGLPPGDDMHCENAFFPGLSNNDGGMAEYLRTTARACVKLDPTTNPADVAALADAGITAYHAVRKAVPLLHPGTTAVVQGAGGLGHIGIQCLKALTGTRVSSSTGTPTRCELAAEIGADDTVVADGDHVAAVEDLTGGGARWSSTSSPSRARRWTRWHMTGAGGSMFVIGYGGELRIPTLDFVAGERTSSATSSARTPTWPS